MPVGDWGTNARIKVLFLRNIPDPTTMAISSTEVNYSIVLPSGAEDFRPSWIWVPDSVSLGHIEAAASTLLQALRDYEGLKLTVDP